ncbi:alpha/beta fold hydrolase [Nocardia sp. NPDC004582]
MTTRRNTNDAAGRFRIPVWLSVTSGVLGSLFGIATNLYSTEFRRALESIAQDLTFDSAFWSVVVTAIVASASTAVVSKILARRKSPDDIVERKMRIDSEVIPRMASEHDSVVGRDLHYLESKRESDELVVFLHGLGLDASDFRPYIFECSFHCVALTLFGFNPGERDDPHYKPISLQAHIQLVIYALEQLRHQYPKKRMTLVGFSFGADVIMFLAHLATDRFKELGVSNVVLLDPNVNNSTTTISSRIANVDQTRPLDQLVRLLSSASDIAEFRYLCEYLYKITGKNFDRIREHAADVVEMWKDVEFDRFLDLLGKLASSVDKVHVVLSFNYERLFNGLARGAAERGLDVTGLECSTSDHFELISPNFLTDRLEGLLSPRPA